MIPSQQRLYAVQLAFLKAFKAFGQLSCNGPDGRQSAAWLLKIVRNTCLTWLKKNANNAAVIHLDAAKSAAERRRLEEVVANTRNAPENQLQVEATRKSVRRAIEQLPIDFREVIVLREFGDLTYSQIAAITGIPLGTVMSRLSRARKQLRYLLLPYANEAQQREV